MHNHYIFPKYRFNDALLLEALEFFKNDGRGIMEKKNDGNDFKAKGGSGKQYAHDYLIDQIPELMEYKQKTINKMAKGFIDYYKLDVSWLATFFTIDANCFFNWHQDRGKYRWPNPTANFMYCLGDCSEEHRAKISFRDDDTSDISEMPVYKCVVFNPQITHAVDNTNFSERINFRFTMFENSFEYIYEQIRKKDEGY